MRETRGERDRSLPRRFALLLIGKKVWNLSPQSIQFQGDEPGVVGLAKGGLGQPLAGRLARNVNNDSADHRPPAKVKNQYKVLDDEVQHLVERRHVARVRPVPTDGDLAVETVHQVGSGGGRGGVENQNYKRSLLLAKGGSGLIEKQPLLHLLVKRARDLRRGIGDYRDPRLGGASRILARFH